MFIKRINANNFRNYNHLSLELDLKKPINIISAMNGMGKSNLLEGIYYLSYVRSFRNVVDKELIQRNKDLFFLEADFYKNSFTNNITISYSEKKEIFYNKKKVKKFSELLGKLISVLFCSEDIFIINGAPYIRRKFFDIFISIIDKKYLYYLKKYQLILKQKNFLLRQQKQLELISIYNIQLGQIISYIQKTRSDIINNINYIFQENYNKIGMFKERVKIVYSPSIKNNIDDCQKIIDLLNNSMKKELNAGHSISGIHRDNYFFLINGIPFSKYASFGQTRLAALVLKLVQTEYYKKIFNVHPVLLLDDVILELDIKKQKFFLEKILDYKQMFITTTNKELIRLFRNIEQIKEIEIEDGKIK